MKRKEIEKIPPLHVEKSADKKFFVAAVKLEEIKGEPHLIIDIYRNLKKELRTPRVRICVTENDFGNYWPDKGYWTKNTIDNVQTADKYLPRENTISITEEAVKIVLQNCKEYWGESWYNRIENAQKRQNAKKRERQTERKYELLDERIKNMPVIPEEFYDWCENELMKGCKYIFYKRQGRYAEFQCSSCGKKYRYPVKAGESYESQFEHIVEIPKAGMVGRCEKCDTKAIYKQAGRGTKKEDKRSCYLIQRYGEKGVVIRYFNIYKMSEAGKTPVLADVEICRAFFVPGMSKVQKDYCIESNFTGTQFWIPNNIPGMATITCGAARLYTANLNELKGTMLEYSAIELWQQDYDCFKVNDYMETYWNTPALEMIVKMGMQYLAEHLIGSTWNVINAINSDGNDAQSILKINKNKIKHLAKEKGWLALHGVMKAEKRLGIDIPEMEEEELATMGFGENDLCALLRYMSPKQLINRVYKYSGIERGIEELCGKAVSHLRNIAGIYKDYIFMRRQLGYDMENTIYLYPRNLQEEHNKLVAESDKKSAEMRIIEVNEKFCEIAERYEQLCGVYEYQDEKFYIRPAKNAGEIVMEGRTLHHCVGGDHYLDGHAKGNSFILFLRPIEEKRVPFVTIELRGNKVVQWYGANNQKPMKREIDKWMDNYLKMVKNGMLRTSYKEDVPHKQAV